MPRKEMTSPQKRRPAPGATSKAGGVNRPRSPSRPRTSRTSPTSTRTTNASNTTSSTASQTPTTFIAPPPRAALSGASSPAPDNPRNTTNNVNNKDPVAPNLTPSLPPRRNRSPSPPPSLLPLGGGAGAGAATPLATAAASTAIATAQAALREKDVRIASLERELALMEAEFHRELDKLSSAESATAAYWQGKYAALEKSVGQMLRAEAEMMDGAGGVGFERFSGREMGRERSRQREGDAERERAAEMEQEIKELRIAWEQAREGNIKRDEEIRELKAQVRGLKEWVSTSTRSDGQAQTSDEVFGEGMARLGNGLQNWVLVNFRRTRVDLSAASEDTISELARLMPMYEELASTSRIHLLQSLVSRLLVELVFDAYFVGLPAEVAGQIKEIEGFLGSYTSSESVNQWRSLTLAILKKDASEKLQASMSAVIDAVISKVNTLLDSITNTRSTEARDQGLQALVTSAIELSRLLAVQKAVFKVEMPEILPHQRIMFNPETMEDIGGEDEESLVDREICCVTFPGIIKRGDESGGHLQYRNVITKAKVLCSPV
ncbi:hypothetical protein VTI74DRAFT_2382 [Chaetomium olivicolor]